MVIQKKDLVLKALNSALRVRQSVGFQLWDALCVYDLAEKLGVEVRFVDIPSMEEMYWKNSIPVILVSAHRPPGRQAFNCAHGLGHHVFNHGTRIDELLTKPLTQRRLDPDEFLADCFAGFLLMTKIGVSRAFAVRGWNTKSCTALEAYTIAGWFGVGYRTLIQHMGYTLNLMSSSRVYELLRIHPKQIRSGLIGKHVAENVIVVDSHWTGRSIDIQVGDFLLLSNSVAFEGNCVRCTEECQRGMLFQGVSPGVGRVYCQQSDWSAFVRVSRRGYVGRSIFRHLEDPDDDQDSPH